MYRRTRYYVPSVAWLPQYSLGKLRGDAVAGLTVASLLVPQSLSYAQALAMLAPEQGLWTALTPLIVYAFFGTSRQLSLGPEALISMLVGSAISDYQAQTQDKLALDASVLATMIGMTVGVLLLLLGVFRLGFVDSIFSRSLLRGFITAVAVVILIEQVVPLLGIDATLGPGGGSGHAVSPLGQLAYAAEHLDAVHWLSAAVSGVSLAALAAAAACKRRWRRVTAVQLFPEILVVVAASTALSAVLGWEALGVRVLGASTGGLPRPRVPPLLYRSSATPLLVSGGLIAAVGFIESLVAARQFAAKYHDTVSPNRELVALGIANIVGSVFGSWPCFASIARTNIMERSGARTQMAGLFAGVVVLLVLRFALPLFHALPRPTLAAIIFAAACGLIETHDFVFLWQLGARRDLALLLCPVAATLLVSVETGVLVSITLSLLLVIRHTTRSPLVLLGRAHVADPATGALRQKFRPLPEDGVVAVDGCLIVGFREALYFGNCSALKAQLRRAELFGELGHHPGDVPPAFAGASIGDEATPLLAPARHVPPSDAEESEADDAASAASFTSPVAWNRAVRGAIARGSALVAGGLWLGAAADEAPPLGPIVRAAVFDLSLVPSLDASAAQTLHELFSSYNARRLEVCVCRMHPRVEQVLTRTGTLSSVVGPQRQFRKVKHALQWLSSRGVISGS